MLAKSHACLELAACYMLHVTCAPVPFAFFLSLALSARSSPPTTSTTPIPAPTAAGLVRMSRDGGGWGNLGNGKFNIFNLAMDQSDRFVKPVVGNDLSAIHGLCHSHAYTRASRRHTPPRNDETQDECTESAR